MRILRILTDAEQGVGELPAAVGPPCPSTSPNSGSPDWSPNAAPAADHHITGSPEPG